MLRIFILSPDTPPILPNKLPFIYSALACVTNLESFSLSILSKIIKAFKNAIFVSLTYYHAFSLITYVFYKQPSAFFIFFVRYTAQSLSHIFFCELSQNPCILISPSLTNFISSIWQQAAKIKQPQGYKSNLMCIRVLKASLNSL